ncbi:hypothetical protein ACFV2U_33075 [Streptomyces sp. NPDC059697]|uniref:hypothetical protein n=1 Tax=Streptomyces sp. NPDC059697 TaxID=3346912 RepID=UPI0036B1D9E0
MPTRFGEAGYRCPGLRVLEGSEHRAERVAGLRTWLRSGADGVVASAVDHALDLVHRTWGETGETLVVVVRTATPMWQIVQRIESLQTERVRVDTE